MAGEEIFTRAGVGPLGGGQYFSLISTKCETCIKTIPNQLLTSFLSFE